MKININGITRDMTPEEEAEILASNAVNAEQEIATLKEQLAATDYKAIKYAEGWITAEEYAPIKAARQAIREEINRLTANMTEG